VEELYERETPLIGQMLEDIDREGLALTSAEEVTGEPATEAEMLGVLRGVVEKYYEDMSDGTLYVLAGYAQAAYSQGHDDVGETLEHIREEILNRTVSQLPDEMQLLDKLVTMMDGPQEERLELIRSVAKESGKSDDKPANLGSLRNTTTQMLEDMESHDVIIDRRLLVRLCLVREEIDLAAQSLGQTQLGQQYHDMLTTSFRLLPMGPTAYIKELVTVSSEEKRRALLERCIKDDFLGEQNEKDQLQKRWRREGVRTGRLMNTITALLTAYAEDGKEVDSPEVQRALDIKKAALALLEELKD